MVENIEGMDAPVREELPPRLIAHIEAHPEHEGYIRALYCDCMPFPMDRETIDGYVVVSEFMLERIATLVRNIAARCPFPLFSAIPSGPLTREAFVTFVSEAIRTAFGVRMLLRGWEAINTWEPFGPFDYDLRDVGEYSELFGITASYVERVALYGIVKILGPFGPRSAYYYESAAVRYPEWVEKVKGADRVLSRIDRDLAKLQPNWRSEASEIVGAVAMPAFMTSEWVSANIALSGSVRSRISSLKADLSRACLDRELPHRHGKDEYGILIGKMFAEPFALHALNTMMAKGGWPREESIFRRFYASLGARAGLDSEEQVRIHDRTFLLSLLEADLVDEALQFAAVRGSEMLDEDFVEVLEFDGIDPGNDILIFLKHRRAIKAAAENDNSDLLRCVLRDSPDPVGDRLIEYSVQGTDKDMTAVTTSTPAERYRNALLEVSAAALQMAEALPEAGSVDRLVSLTGTLPGLLAEYVNSLPKRVTAAPVLLRAGAVRGEIVDLAEHVGVAVSLPDLPILADLSEAGAEGVTLGLDKAEGQVATVRANVERADVLHGELLTAKLVARKSLADEMGAVTGLVEVGIEEASVTYREVTALLAEDAEGAGSDTAAATTSGESGGMTAEDGVAHSAGESAEVDASAAPIERAATEDASVAEIESEAAAEPVSDPVADEVVADTPEVVGEVREVATDDVFAAEEEDLSLDAEDLVAISALGEVSEVVEDAPSEDPHLGRIGERVWNFVADGSIGLAYHLTTAAERMYGEAGLPVSAAEFRFAAMSGSMDHATINSRPDIAGDAVNALYSIPGGLPTAEDDISVARRFMLYPAAVELAVFHPDSGAENVLRQLNGLGEQVTSASHALTDSVQKVSRMRLDLTPALLGLVGEAIDAESGAAQTRKELVDRLEAFARSRYNFMLGVRVLNQLFLSASPLGHLKGALDADDDKALAAARSFKDAYSTRNQIIDMLREGELAATGRYQGIDGAVRDRMVATLLGIASLAADYVERRVAQSEINDKRPKITQAVAELMSKLTAARVAFEEVAALENGGLPSVAAKFVADRFARLEVLLSSGKSEQVPSYGISLALHGELPLVARLHFGRSWYPAPYEPGDVVQALLDAPRPLLPAKGKDEAFETVYRRRVAEGSFVGAMMMVQLADRYGVSESLRARLSDQLATDLDAAKVDIEANVERTREVVDRVIRFGTIDRPEDANRHASTVERVQAAEVPVTVSLEERVDEIVEERIEDIRIARLLLAEVNEEIGDLMDVPRQRLMAEIDALATRLPENDIEQLRKLCRADDLLTASEFVGIAQEKGTIPADLSRIRRFDTFSGHVLPELAGVKSHAEGAAAALTARTPYCGLPFDGLSEGRVEEAYETLSSWRALFRNIGAARADNTYASRVANLLDRLGMSARLVEEHNSSKAQLKRFVGDFNLQLPLDAESLLLPDFGSLTEGLYRVCMTATLPTEAHLADWCRTAGKSGVVLMVNDLVTTERRQQFMMQNLAAQRRVILIDIASFLFSLSEPEQRALTLFEMAQPYSYAAPYRDWERDAVPLEMFTGRSAELATLYEPSGSAIVYGGRRMGKTAVLRHLVTRFNDPAQGVQVSYIDVQGIDQGQALTKHIWFEISKALSAIFKKPVNEQTKVVEGIQSWLSMDPRRRVLILIDEADDFVRADAAQGYPELLALQRLMTDTRRRFKFVLSGLHNVSRAIMSGNDPLKHISSAPQRIGPLMGAELADAESLVVRPFAALGMEFANRSDVWRILSHANYYPVLVQTYGRHLMELVLEEVRRTQTPMRQIPSALVHKVFERRQASEEVKDKFLLTLRIDLRYELIAYVVANLVIGNEAAGEMEEGVSVNRIRECSISFWPAGFRSRSAMSQFDDLVDEMEGLGILRRTPSGNWTLRSQAVLRLLGTREDIETVLLDFSEREAPAPFDPKSGRRELTVGEDIVASPLTLSQEREILTDVTRVKVVFGTDAGGVDLVAQALRSAATSFSDTDSQEIQTVVPRTKGELVERINKIKVLTGSQTVLIVHSNADWEPDWISAALRARAVTSGSVRVVFVGRPKHLVRVEGNFSAIRSNDVRVFGVEPWSQTFVDERVLNRFANMDAETRAAIGAGTGWWGRPMSAILLAANNQKVKTRLERAMSDYASPEAYGVGPEMAAICSLLMETLDGRFTRDDLKELLQFDELNDKVSGIWKEPNAVLDYGLVLGIFVAVGDRKGEAAGLTFALADPLPGMDLRG